MLSEDRARMAAYPSAVYREVGGVPLYVHVMRPTGGDSAGERPAMLWFHGGSGTTGSWYQSPGIISALRQRGVTVLAIEFRTGARFDNDADALSDAARAYQWAVRTGASFGIDTARIGVAGFSSGSLLALQLATMGVDMTTGAVSTSAAVTSRRLPAGVIVTGACPNPAEDAYTRKMIARHGSAIQPSPMSHVASGLPPMLIVQASDDKYCAFADADRFARMLQAAGNRADFVEVPGGGHFFGFYYPPGQRLLRDGITRALQQWGWMPR
jgi:acetyl esterase/lipase